MDNVAIIGGGPAALSCALWLESFHIDYHLYGERDSFGGQLWNVSNPVRNFGPVEYATGQDLAEAVMRQLAPRSGTSSRVDEIRRTEHGWELHGAFDPAHFSTVVIATGTSYRTLGIPGEKSAFVSQSATKDGARFANRRVAVVGGGDAAFENALILAGHGCEVVLYSRSAYRARSEFVQRAMSVPSIAFEPIGVIPTSIVPKSDHCLVNDNANSVQKFGGVFVRIGVEATYPVMAGIAIDATGAIIVDDAKRTNLDGIYAIGDVTNTALRSVSTAVGDGAFAAKDIFTTRERCSKKS